MGVTTLVATPTHTHTHLYFDSSVLEKEVTLDVSSILNQWCVYKDPPQTDMETRTHTLLAYSKPSWDTCLIDSVDNWPVFFSVIAL